MTRRWCRCGDSDDQMNPGSVARDCKKSGPSASSKLDFSAPDVADKELLNRVIGYATKRYDRAYLDGRERDRASLATSATHS